MILKLLNKLEIGKHPLSGMNILLCETLGWCTKLSSFSRSSLSFNPITLGGLYDAAHHVENNLISLIVRYTYTACTDPYHLWQKDTQIRYVLIPTMSCDPVQEWKFPWNQWYHRYCMYRISTQKADHAQFQWNAFMLSGKITKVTPSQQWSL